MTNPYPKLLSWVDEGRLAILLTVIESSHPQEIPAGAKWLFSEEGKLLEGSDVPPELLQVLRSFALRQSQEAQPRLEHLDSLPYRLVVYGEPITPEPHLYLFGGGHVSQAVAKAAVLAGFHPIVVEDRPQFARAELFPDGTEFRLGEWQETISSLDFHVNDYLVILTRSHAYDNQILRQVINQPWKYLGMIGSKKKVSEAFHRLLEQGVSRERIQRIHAPIGLDLGAQTPGEIAISIVAEMIAVRYHRSKVERVPIPLIS